MTCGGLDSGRRMRQAPSSALNVKQACVQINAATRGRQYTGPLYELARALSDCPNGGQIVCDMPTLDGIKAQLASLWRDSRKRVSLGARAELARCRPTPPAAA